MNIAYECKFCNKPGLVTVSDPEAMFQVPKWKPMLACNRCADYMERKRALIERIGTATTTLSQFRMTRAGEKLNAAEAKLREKLGDITKQLSSVVCDYNYKSNVWDIEFVNLLMEHPMKFWGICNQYVRNIKTIV